MIPTPEQLQNAPNPEFERRVVIKFRDDVNVPFQSGDTAVASADPPPAADPPPTADPALAAGAPPTGPNAFWVSDVTLGRPGGRVERMFTVPVAQLRDLRQRARANAGSASVPNLENFFSVVVPADAQPDAVLSTARALPGVEVAYLQGAPTAPPIDASNDPQAATQGYLDPAPAGIDAKFAWTRPGGTGTGVTFIDMERGWTLTHEDLTGASISLISGLSKDYHGHGTAVLGEVVGQDNDKGVVGITPGATAKVVSQWRTNTNYNTADAIISAVMATPVGAVLLLEAQTTFGTQSNLPVEVEDAAWAAIRVATWLGTVVVEAAGNGGHDLDAFSHPTHGFMLRRGHANFRDSGAIMVGAASSAAPHTRMSFSCFGSRIDCFGWGQNITTTGDGWTGNLNNTYTTSFSGTSGASPIVTGAAVATQGMHKAALGRFLLPADLRTLLTDPALATASSAPATDKIGVMPDLRRIAGRVTATAPAGPTGPITLHADTERIAMAFNRGVFGSLNLTGIPASFLVGVYTGWGGGPITAFGRQVSARFGLRVLRHAGTTLASIPTAWHGPTNAWPTFPQDQFLAHPLYLRPDQTVVAPTAGTTAPTNTPTDAPHEIQLAAGRWYALVRYTVAASGGIRTVDIVVAITPGTGEAVTWHALCSVAGGTAPYHFVQSCVFRAADGLAASELTGTALFKLVSMVGTNPTPP